MNAVLLLAFGVIGLLASWLLNRVVIARSLGCVQLDQTRQFHHIHKSPVPRFGGIALAGAFLILSLSALLFQPDSGKTGLYLTAVAGAMAMFAMGLYDDFKPLGARKKFLLQIIIAAAVYGCGVEIDYLKNPLTGMVYHLGVWSGITTVLWLVAFTNLINLIDGIDGLAGGISLMMMALLAFVTYATSPFCCLVAVGTAGALLGFLRFNFPPARIYMGDGGAYFLGFLIGVLAIESSHKGTVAAALIAPIIALGLPIIDTSLAILRRGVKGLPIFRPDQKHIHHKLLKAGLSRTRAVLVLYGLSLAFLLMAFGAFWAQGKSLPLLFGVATLALAISLGSLGLVSDWLSVREVVGANWQMRKQTRDVLAMTRWFELDCERCESVDELWEDFQFMVRKMGFSKVRLVLDNREEVSQFKAPHQGFTGLHWQRFEFQGAHPMVMELAAPERTMSAKLFEHISELAAESWQKTVHQWGASKQAPVRFGRKTPPPGRPPAKATSSVLVAVSKAVGVELG